MTQERLHGEKPEIWLRTDQREEFIGALEHSAELATSIGEGVMRWKWLILALHNALQGACTCALRGKDSVGISMLTEKSAKEVWHWLDAERREKMPEPRLPPLLDLYKRVESEKYLEKPYRLPPTEQMNEDVLWLNKWRNEFVHFVPRGVSLEVSGMPRIVRNCCEVIKHLAVKQPTFWHRLEESHLETCLERVKTALSQIWSGMDAWESVYGGGAAGR
jgi:hypothetical protein